MSNEITLFLIASCFGVITKLWRDFKQEKKSVHNQLRKYRKIVTLLALQYQQCYYSMHGQYPDLAFIVEIDAEDDKEPKDDEDLFDFNSLIKNALNPSKKDAADA